jgi:ubiquinone/menaquinone biosynthesis C-methylase UbiE
MEFWDRKYTERYKSASTHNNKAEVQPEKTSGNRYLSRDKHIFSLLRTKIARKVLLEIGCGDASYVRNLCNPTKYQFMYVGADISFNSLKIARTFTAGDFVQCSIRSMPFREGVVMCSYL